jgi:hypothetical protein
MKVSMQGHSQPPADAVPLAEADPYIANTLRWRRRQRTSTAIIVPPERVWIIGKPRMDDDGRWHTPVRASDDLVAGKQALRDLLAEGGELLAWGREGSPWGPWRAIEPHTWGLLTIEDLEQGIVRVAAPSEVRLYSVVVANKETALTQAAVPTAPDAPASTAAAETRCRKWLIEEMASGACKESNIHNDIQSVPPAPTNEETTTIRQFQSKHYQPEKVKAWYLRWVESCKQEGSIPSREDDLRAATDEFPNINREQVRAARREVAPDDWKKAGPRRKARDT